MIFLKKLNPNKDITKKYQSWMNDKIVHQFTEQGRKKHSVKDVKKFVIEKNKSKNEFLFGIFLRDEGKLNHIGNIKLGPINFIHKTAEISYFIGDKNLWGNNYATNAITQILTLAKTKKIKKIKACLHEMNHGSKKVLKKNGFKLEGTFLSEIIYKKKRYKRYWMGKILK
mgnify:FL=1|jgi:ribosomal-protein-alanine N-acetyltransferase